MVHRPMPCRPAGLLAVGLALVLGACQSAPPAEAEADTPLFFPFPPETPRVQYLTWASGAEQMEEQVSAFDKFVLGADPQARPRINKPFGLAARDGVVYVCDSQDACIGRLDFKNRKYSVFGNSGAGQLKLPVNIVIDELGYKFVADALRNEVVVFGPDDGFVKAHALPKPSRVVDVSVYENELYVLDNDKTPQVLVLDRSSGNVLRTFGGQGNEAGKFNAPAGITVSPDGFVYVCDAVATRVQKLTREGQPVWLKGEQGYHIGQLGRPRSIRAAPNGVIYIADAATELVQLWNSDGKSLMYLGGPGNVPGAMILPSGVAIDATSVPYFKKYIHKDFQVEYLVFTANQFGKRLVNVYAFGSFPEGYKLGESAVRTIPIIPSKTQEPLGPEPGTEPGKEAEKKDGGGDQGRGGGS